MGSIINSRPPHDFNAIFLKIAITPPFYVRTVPLRYRWKGIDYYYLWPQRPIS